jgi:hypothetical protein
VFKTATAIPHGLSCVSFDTRRPCNAFLNVHHQGLGDIMKTKDSLRILGGSLLVYLAVATCAGSGSGTARRDGGGRGTSSENGDVLGVLDGLADPVPVAAADPNKSGSRLKARYYAGSDGSKQFIGWHDSQLNADCSFVDYSDGTKRCMPSVQGSVGTYFSDAGCAQPLILVQTGPGCTVPKYAAKSTPNSCPSSPGTLTLYNVGPSFTGTAFSGTASSCSKVTTTLPGYAAYSLGAEVPPSTLVAATVETDS